MLVVMVLVGNVLPLFQRNTLSRLIAIESSHPAQAMGAGADEYGEICWVAYQDASLCFYAIQNGEPIGRFAPQKDESKNTQVTCLSIADDDSSLLFGFEDGSVQPVTFRFDLQFLKPIDADETAMSNGFVVDGSKVLRKTGSGLIRSISVEDLTYHPKSQIFSNPVTSLDWRTQQNKSGLNDSSIWNWSASDGRSLCLAKVENKISLSGATTSNSDQWLNAGTASTPQILSLMVDPRGEQLGALDRHGNISFWMSGSDGKLVRTETPTHLSLAGSESRVTCASPLLGRTSFLLGSESGHIEAVAMTAFEQSQELQSIHRFRFRDSPLKNMICSPTTRMVAVSDDRGEAGLFYIPTNKNLLAWKLPETNCENLFFSASSQLLGSLANNTVTLWRIHVPHPEASLSGFFSRIWYEGYPSPQHIWQSSTGNIEGEYKFGFVPLIFGTLKATFYSMLIGAPIALLAAIFSSEFMSSRWRTRIKPAIELMASVPSVVLGFIGALVLAPLLRDHLVTALLCPPAILFLFLLGAHVWLLLPNTLSIRWARFRLAILLGLIPTGIAIAILLSGMVELYLFDANVMQWLAGQSGTGWPGWFCLGILPISLLVAWFVSGPASPYLLSRASTMTAPQFAIWNLGVFLTATGAVFLLSALVATTMQSVGIDPRGSLLGPYQERNALLVGCILGFAIIPLIYTISEDALQSVPQHLRSASLGCGATTWQTTIRVVVPTAMSGLFSAMMIGFGRAVGETMVVLMAAGNTPLIDVNPMNGYRTLSATLATELPEAARGSTHYHSLFLAALLLFCFTLVANTIAELVRIRFRKRAYQL